MRTLIIIVAMLSLSACKNSSQAMDSDSIEPSNSRSTKKITVNDEYALIISFTSIAMGIDYEIKKKVDNIIESFNKDFGTSIIPKKIGWGREGEVDYNFTLKNLSTEQKDSFISKIKASIGGSDTVQLFFNKKSVHKR